MAGYDTIQCKWTNLSLHVVSFCKLPCMRTRHIAAYVAHGNTNTNHADEQSVEGKTLRGPVDE
eukprot:CAMPEP_0198109314 /NCGR_PEP_ID=MMETSP1442-20131203/1340_1 /TAXON_ID= /ORGANISM="Craspedostauros australis, Strain CCMP3328" /LENGTH=62 /DNA_ID=CAMNT_0043764909 /DNA_START=45 /DNA_END=230 /DNA_ORIENTATION=-